MRLSDLASTGEVEELRITRKELDNLLASASRRLKDAGNPHISPETRLNLAYQVILTMAKAALRAAGYRVRGHADEHLRTINTLRYTLQKDRQAVRVYQTLRQKRNKDLYTGSLVVSNSEAREALKEAKALLREARSWLREHHPELIE